jgi:hypothetical protein
MADRDSTREAKTEPAPEITAAQAARAGQKQVTEMLGTAPEAVTGVEPTEDGWLVTVEVVEDRRIPSSADILATYQAEIGLDGDLISYRRVNRYARGHGIRGD